MPLSISDKFKNILTDTDREFVVKSIMDWMVVLESSDKSSQVLTEKESLRLFYKRIESGDKPESGNNDGSQPELSNGYADSVGLHEG
jgi:hypothetical protein